MGTHQEKESKTVRLMIETTAPLSETDYRILSLLLERHEAVAPAEGEPAAKPKTEAAKPAPKKAEPKPEPEPEPEAPSAEPETTEDEPVSDDLLDEAVAKAKALVQDGKKAAVKQALESAGVARVGAIETASQANAFLAALGA